MSQTVQALLETLYLVNQSYQVNNPKWWLNTMELVHQEKIQNGQWQDLQEAISKLIKTWNRFCKSWEVNSFNTLQTNLAQVPGGILAMLFPLELMSNYHDLWNSYAPMVNQELMVCLDSQSKQTTSMSSTTAHTAMEHADAASEGSSNLSDNFAQPESITDTFGNYQKPTGTMCSFISTVQNGEHVKSGIEEQVGKYRLSVSSIFY